MRFTDFSIVFSIAVSVLLALSLSEVNAKEHDERVLEPIVHSDVSTNGLYPNPAKPQKRWRLVWSDEFNGPPCDPTEPGSCSSEDWLRTVQCYGTPDSPVPTLTPHRFHVNPDEPDQWSTQIHPHLAELDKCTWLVSDHVNMIHFQGDWGPITAYTPSNVMVSDGEMRITTRRYHPERIDCGRKIEPDGPEAEENRTKDCPFRAGNVFSYAMNGLDNAGSPNGNAIGDGRVFRDGGRIEVRARLPHERGNMSALWTWQQDWRQHEREYDLLENWVNWPEMHASSLQSPSTSVSHIFEPEYKYSLSREFHTYVMEWKKGDFMSFFLDNVQLHKWLDGDPIKDNKTGQCVENRIYGNPFYFIFWNIIMDYSYAPQAAPRLSGQMPDTLYIDYIRYYEPCDEEHDPSCVESTLSTSCPNPCEGFGFFDGFNCYVGSPPASRRARIVKGEFAYLAVRSGLLTFRCPYGGVRDGRWCLLGRPPSGRDPFVWSNLFYTKTVCSPTELPNCSNPCPWPDTVWEKGSCRVGPPPDGTRAFVHRNSYYYEALTHDPATACSAGGSWDGANCWLGSPPHGAKARVIDNVFYLEADHCPYGGSYDEAVDACLLEELPSGVQAFVWSGALYYKPLTSNPETACPCGGWFDSVNCYLRGMPEGSEPFAIGNRIYTTAVCHPATDWVALQRVVGQTIVTQHGCKYRQMETLLWLKSA